MHEVETRWGLGRVKMYAALEGYQELLIGFIKIRIQRRLVLLKEQKGLDNPGFENNINKLIMESFYFQLEGEC